MTTETESIKMKVAELQTAILEAHPRMPVLLKDIYTILKNDPENCTLLSEEEIGIIVNGLEKQTSISLASTALKKKTSLKNTSVDDL